MNLGTTRKETFDLSRFQRTYLKSRAWISLRRLEEANMIKKTVFQVSNLIGHLDKGSKGSLDRIFRTNDKSHWATT